MLERASVGPLGNGRPNTAPARRRRSRGVVDDRRAAVRREQPRRLFAVGHVEARPRRVADLLLRLLRGAVRAAARRGADLLAQLHDGRVS